MYSPGHNRASSLALSLASSRVCASSTNGRLPSPRNLKMRKGKGIQTPDEDDLLGGTVKRLSHQFSVLGGDGGPPYFHLRSSRMARRMNFAEMWSAPSGSGEKTRRKNRGPQSDVPSGGGYVPAERGLCHGQHDVDTDVRPAAEAGLGSGKTRKGPAGTPV